MKWGEGMRFDIPSLTPELATMLLVLRPERQRRLKPPKLREYTTAMEKGRWRRTGVPMILNKDWELVDGQHRCQAVIDSQVSLPDYVLNFAPDPEVALAIDNGLGREVYQLLRFMTGISLRKAAIAAIIMEVFDFGPVPSTLQKADIAKICKRYDLIEDAQTLDLIGKKVTRPTTGMLAGALRAIRISGNDARDFYFSAFANNHEVKDARAPAARSLASWMIDQATREQGTKKRPFGGNISMVSAERVMREFLRWKEKDGTEGKRAPQAKGEVPVAFRANKEVMRQLMKIRRAVDEDTSF